MEQGFYNLIDGELYYGPFVQFPDGVYLYPDNADEFTYPYRGWMFFGTLSEAQDYFKIENS
jgi:hypothetical protein